MMFYNILLSIIAAASYFTQAYVFGGETGAPDRQALVYNLNAYQVGWRLDAMGRSCALAWMLLGVVICITAVLFRTSSRWVYYSGGER